MSYRLIQWGTGNVGKHALRTIIERPSYELVGVRVYNPDKVGKDAGGLIGAPDTGVLATDDVEQILALDADCVCYTALGSTLGDWEQSLDDICRLLASGKNVVSSAVEYFAYFHPHVLPGRDLAEPRKKLETACRAGGTSFYHVGINPGFTMDAWPIMMSRLSRRIEKIQVVELVDMTAYASPHMVCDVLGFGGPGDTDSPALLAMADLEQSAYAIPMHMLSDAIGFDVEEMRFSHEVALASETFTVTAGTIEAGTVAAQKFRFEGVHQGRTIVDLALVWRLSDDVAPDWPSGASRWILRIDGDPTIESEVAMSTSYDTKRAVSLSVATLTLNAVPVVCAAAPGLLDNLSIPVHGGGHVLSTGNPVL